MREEPDDGALGGLVAYAILALVIAALGYGYAIGPTAH